VSTFGINVSNFSAFYFVFTTGLLASPINRLPNTDEDVSRPQYSRLVLLHGEANTSAQFSYWVCFFTDLHSFPLHGILLCDALATFALVAGVMELTIDLC
jgi:hypothetical protein